MERVLSFLNVKKTLGRLHRSTAERECVLGIVVLLFNASTWGLCETQDSEEPKASGKKR